MTLFRSIATVAVVAMSVIAYAQTDQGRFTGTVRDQSNAFVGGATVKVKNERTGEERVVLSNQQGYFLVGSLKPSTYTIRAEKDGFAPIEYTEMAVAVGQELNLDFEFKPAGVQRVRDRRRHGAPSSTSAPRASASTSASAKSRTCRSTADRCRSYAAGAGIAERRHRHVAGHPVQRPRRRAERDPLRRHRRVGHHRRGAGQPERRGRDAIQAAGEPRERPGVPRRVEQLPGGIRHRQRRSGQRHHQIGRQRVARIGCSNTSATTRSTRATTSTTRERRRLRRWRAPQVAAQAESVRRLVRRADRQGPRVLLRQLRGVPAERRHQHRRSRAERGGLGARRSRHCRAAPRLSGARARSFCRASRRIRTSTSRSCRRRQKSRENAFSARARHPVQQSLVELRARFR